MDGGDPTGGSNELARLIDECGEILLPELKHYFGIDLRDLFTEERPLSPRYVLAHILWLPAESAFTAHQRGGMQFRGWNEQRYMQAMEINVARLLLHVFIAANSDPKKSKPKQPEPYPIPDGLKLKKPDAPGSFASVAKNRIAAARKLKGR